MLLELSHTDRRRVNDLLLSYAASKRSLAAWCRGRGEYRPHVMSAAERELLAEQYEAEAAECAHLAAAMRAGVPDAGMPAVGVVSDPDFAGAQL